MGALLDEFEQRRAEADHFLKLVIQLSSSSDPLPGKRRDRERAPLIYANELSVTLAKASYFLVLYNLVEATIRSGFTAIWDEVHSGDVAISVLSESMKLVWLKHEFRKIDPYSSNATTYRRAAAGILEFSLGDQTPRVIFRNLSGGGNWGLAELRDICAEHNLKFSPPPSARGGTDLDSVRDKRNKLAHGSMTFEEIGRGVSVSELRGASSRVISTMRYFVRQVERYMSKAGYAA